MRLRFPEGGRHDGEGTFCSGKQVCARLSSADFDLLRALSLTTGYLGSSTPCNARVPVTHAHRPCAPNVRRREIVASPAALRAGATQPRRASGCATAKAPGARKKLLALEAKTCCSTLFCFKVAHVLIFSRLEEKPRTLHGLRQRSGVDGGLSTQLPNDVLLLRRLTGHRHHHRFRLSGATDFQASPCLSG